MRTRSTGTSPPVRGEVAAIRYDSPVTGTRATITYAALLDLVSHFAGVLADLGVGRGDRVLVYMPMIPEAVVAMLACARLGAVHSVVFGGFAPAELAARIDDAEPTVIVSASCGIEPSRVIAYKPLLDEALRIARHVPIASIVLQRPEMRAEMGERDVDWHERIAASRPHEAVPVRATDPLYILYTSGTTGRPKGVVRDNGGHAVAMAWSFDNVYGMGPDDTWWAASDVGWVVGHSYIVYAPLISGATTVLYEGKPVGTPDAAAFWRVIAEYGVAGLFTAPTAIRAIKKEDPEGHLIPGHDLSSLRALFLAGERLDPDTYYWAAAQLGVPVVDNWWQTETGWPIASNLRGLEPMTIKPGSPTVPVPGYDVRVVDGEGDDVPAGQDGAIVIRLPLPPGTLPTLWGDDQRYIDSYLSVFPGCYTTGDGGYLDEDGYVFVMGRTDDVINVAGHRLSTGSDGGRGGRASARGRVRRHRRARSAQGAGAARVRRAEGGRRHRRRCSAAGDRRVDPRPDRTGCRAEGGRRGSGPAQDPVREDPAAHDARDRRRPARAGAEHDRGRASAGGDHPVPGGARRPEQRLNHRNTDGTVHHPYRWVSMRRMPTTPVPGPSADSLAAAPDLIVVANRLPIEKSGEAAEAQWQRSPGGLVSALEPALQGRRAAWIGWSGSLSESGEATPGLPAELDGLALDEVPLTDADIRAYYEGFSDGTIWPLYHDAVAPPAYHRHEFERYVDVNRRFADVVAKAAPPGGVVWVHDYQLQLVPRLLRERRPDLRIGFFLHIPFPPFELFAQLPWRRQILEGLLGADLVGFQTVGGAQNFLAATRRLLGLQPGGDRVKVPEIVGYRTVRVGSFPIGIDAAAFEALAMTAEVQARAREIRRELGGFPLMFLGVDRLDYTKGIDIRLRAFGEAIEEGILDLNEVTLLQIATPSRENVERVSAHP